MDNRVEITGFWSGLKAICANVALAIVDLTFVARKTTKQADNLLDAADVYTKWCKHEAEAFEVKAAITREAEITALRASRTKAAA
jgi:hypothetical protein